MEHLLTQIVPPSADWLRRVRNFGVWLDVWSERRALDQLDARMLADIGITDSEARHESQRAPWDLPQNRIY